MMALAPASAASATILVVDDDEDVRDALDSALADEGYRVVLARDGVEALALLKQRACPSLIMLDLTMPRMNGVELARRVSAELPQLSGVPMIVLSADVEGRSEAQAIGAAAFLRKPIRLKELLRTVDKELHRQS